MAQYLEHGYNEAIETYERAYVAHREEGNGVAAVRTARMLGYFHHVFRGDHAVGGGWSRRAQTLAADAPDSAEAGWVQLQFGMWQPDRPKKEGHFQAALDTARRFKDTDLEFLALAYLGASMVYGQRIEEGMLLLDESLAAVAGGEVKGFMSLEEIFCQLFSACEHARDVVRAEQWIRVGEEVSARRNLPVARAFCRTHYGGLLTAAGRWEEAGAALTEAARLWASGPKALRWTALVRLADLRVRQGRYEEAEQLLEGMDLNVDSARPTAALQLARGDAALAAETIERGLAQLTPNDGLYATPLYSLLVDVEIAQGSIERAAAAADRLEEMAQATSNPYVCASAALARGRVCLASGSGDPAGCLRGALSGFAKAQLPMELAYTRLELAKALSEGRPEAAIAEATAALNSFEQLQAAREVDAAASLLRRLGGPARTGPKSQDVLTKREAEVLELLGHGMSNAQIADRLFISHKTVEHHVGRILAKLGLRSRAEAGAYAARLEKPVTR